MKPYYAAFQHTLEWLSQAVDNGKVPKSERIAFVFDQQQEHEGIATSLYGHLQDDEKVPFRHRLGSLTFDSRLNRVQLQVADVLAYENTKYIREVVIRGGAERWQYRLMREVKYPHELGFARLEMPQLAFSEFSELFVSLSWHDSILSREGASDNPGAIQVVGVEPSVERLGAGMKRAIEERSRIVVMQEELDEP